MTTATSSLKSVPAGIGHNQPPSDIDIVGERFKELYRNQLSNAEELLAQADAVVPEEINDDETAGRVGDFIKQVTAAMKSLESARSTEKEEYLKKGRAVDGFFKRYTEKLNDLKLRASKPAGEYKDRKDAELARQREEAAQRQREEAEAKLREAQRLQKEAEEARERQRQESERIEREAAAERKRIADEAEEARRKQQEEIDRLRREQEEKDKAAREEIARMKADADKKDMAAKQAIADAEAQRKAEADAHREEMRLQKEKQEQIERDRREAEKAARDQEREAEQNLKELGKAAKAQERESNKLLDEAVRHDKQAQKMDSAADNANARIRSEGGSLTVTTHVWIGTMTDRATLDLEALRAHLPEEALHRAVQSFANAGGRQLRGAHIFEDTKVQVR